MTNILLLGGTTDASRMAHAIADAGLFAEFSYAGRTEAPIEQPLPTRIGGFGGVPGLVRYLQENGITHVIDATHPFAAQMSRNAVEACAAAGVALMALERRAWAPVRGDRWIEVPDMAGAAAALPDEPASVFLTIGRLQLEAFAAKPGHRYLARLVNVPTDPVPFPNIEFVAARGPFTVEGDLALMRRHATTWLVTKNSGGKAASAKLQAARQLGVQVVMVARPALPERPVRQSVEDVMAWLKATHPARLGV